MIYSLALYLYFNPHSFTDQCQLLGLVVLFVSFIVCIAAWLNSDYMIAYLDFSSQNKGNSFITTVYENKHNLKYSLILIMMISFLVGEFRSIFTNKNIININGLSLYLGTCIIFVLEFIFAEKSRNIFTRLQSLFDSSTNSFIPTLLTPYVITSIVILLIIFSKNISIAILEELSKYGDTHRLYHISFFLLLVISGMYVSINMFNFSFIGSTWIEILINSTTNFLILLKSLAIISIPSALWILSSINVCEEEKGFRLFKKRYFERLDGVKELSINLESNVDSVVHKFIKLSNSNLKQIPINSYPLDMTSLAITNLTILIAKNIFHAIILTIKILTICLIRFARFIRYIPTIFIIPTIYLIFIVFVFPIRYLIFEIPSLIIKILYQIVSAVVDLILVFRKFVFDKILKKILSPLLLFISLLILIESLGELWISKILNSNPSLTFAIFAALILIYLNLILFIAVTDNKSLHVVYYEVIEVMSQRLALYIYVSTGFSWLLVILDSCVFKLNHFKIQFDLVIFTIIVFMVLIRTMIIIRNHVNEQ